MFPPTATPRPERSDAVEFLREGSRVTAFWDVQKMMMNYAVKTRPRRAFGKRPPAPRKPKGKPGRPFVGAHGGGSRRVDLPWVHSPRAEGPGLVKVGGQARKGFRKAPPVDFFAWLPVGVNYNKPARGSVSLI
jgi:hypothetical protein